MVASSAGPATLSVNSGAASDFSGMVIDGVGPVGLVKAGSGSLTLHAANTYSGGTTISGGTLGLADAGQLGASSGSVTIGAATLQTTGAVALDNTIDLTDVGSTLSTPTVFDSMTLNGYVTGSGALNKTGAGTVAPADSNGNDYSGDTNVLAGTLLANSSNALSPNSNLMIGDGASVILNFGDAGVGFNLGGAPALAAPFAAAPALAGPMAPPAGISTVPEPCSLLLLLVGALVSLLVWRRKR